MISSRYFFGVGGGVFNGVLRQWPSASLRRTSAIVLPRGSYRVVTSGNETDGSELSGSGTWDIRQTHNPLADGSNPSGPIRKAPLVGIFHPDGGASIAKRVPNAVRRSAIIPAARADRPPNPGLKWYDHNRKRDAVAGLPGKWGSTLGRGHFASRTSGRRSTCGTGSRSQRSDPHGALSRDEYSRVSRHLLPWRRSSSFRRPPAGDSRRSVSSSYWSIKTTGRPDCRPLAHHRTNQRLSSIG